MSLITHYCKCGNGLNCTIVHSALKLQELVKERINELKKLQLTEHPLEHIGGCEYKQRYKEFQSLIEESEK